MNSENLISLASIAATYALFAIAMRTALRTFEGLSMRWERFLDGTSKFISGAALGFVDLVCGVVAFVPRKAAQRLSRRRVVESGPLEHAAEVLGLSGSFTRQDFERNLRQAAAASHPDTSGSPWLYKIVWDSAELIVQSKGWNDA